MLGFVYNIISNKNGNNFRRVSQRSSIAYEIEAESFEDNSSCIIKIKNIFYFSICLNLKKEKQVFTKLQKNFRAP